MNPLVVKLKSGEYDGKDIMQSWCLIEDLEQQNAELVAHYEELATALTGVMVIIENNCKSQKLKTGFITAKESLSRTPIQSLAKHDAEVIFNAIEVLPQWNNDDVEVVIKVDELMDYANQLREQGK